MRIRITGTPEQTAAAVEALAGVLEFREISDVHPNEASSVLLDAEPRAIRATGECVDQPDMPPRREGGRR